MITVIFAAVLLVVFLGGLTHYLQRGLGDMSAALKQLGMFMLTKAPAGIIDLFKDDDGNGAKTWIQFGCFWFVLSAIGGFLGAWHEYDAKALDSLASIGWSWENGDAMTLFNLTTLSAAIFSILLGGALIAHSRANGGHLASEANASLMAFGWFNITLLSLVLPIFIEMGDFHYSLIGMVYAAMVGSMLVNVLLTNAQSDSPTGVSSWFLIMGLAAMIYGLAIDALGEITKQTTVVWMADAIVRGWVPLALMFSVGYHVIPRVTGHPIWSGSLTKASMLLLFVTVTPFFLSQSSTEPLLQSVGAILVTIGMFPILAFSVNMICTMRGDASSVVHSPGAVAAIAAALLLPLFAVLAFFTGLNVMVGDASLTSVATTVNMGYLYTIGGLFCLAVMFELYPLASGNRLAGTSAGLATWLVIFGGLFSTTVSLMADWTFIEISALVDDATIETVSGFNLTASVGFYCITMGILLGVGTVSRTAFSRIPSDTGVVVSSDVSTFTLVEGSTSIRSLLGRGVGLDTELVISDSEEEGDGGSTIIEVSAALHNDEVDEFPAEEEEKEDYPEELVELTKWLCARGTTAKQFFDWADVDKSGSLDMFELGNALKVGEVADLPPWDMEKLVQAMDINNDGNIDLPELDILLMMIRNKHDIEFVEFVPEDDGSNEESSDDDSADDSIEEVTTPSKSELNKMKKAELVEVAKSLGLDSKGTKKDLIERITQ
jgi:Ca2+-binding EF-hand superfamily protein